MKRAALFVAFVLLAAAVEIALISLGGSLDDGHPWLARLINIDAVVSVYVLQLLYAEAKLDTCTGG